jgi:hypothetical protein
MPGCSRCTIIRVGSMSRSNCSVRSVLARKRSTSTRRSCRRTTCAGTSVPKVVESRLACDPLIGVVCPGDHPGQNPVDQFLLRLFEVDPNIEVVLEPVESPQRRALRHSVSSSLGADLDRRACSGRATDWWSRPATSARQQCPAVRRRRRRERLPSGRSTSSSPT